MKQYTDESQTAKLIELGFEKPKYDRLVDDIANQVSPEIKCLTRRYDYSIGELIDMLPDTATQHIRYVATKKAWTITVDVLGKSNNPHARCYIGSYHPHLINALYEMVVKLKEEGVI